MKILGVSSNYHDASSCLTIDGQVIACSTEERFSLIKHDPSFPSLSSQFCLKQANIKASDLDFIAYHEDPAVKFSRTLTSSFLRFPFSRGTFVKSMQEAISSGLKIRSDLSHTFDIDPDRILYVPHHLSHAAQSYYGSGFDDAAILTIDAAGEWTCSGIFHGRGNQIVPLDAVFFPHSLGLIYSAFTAFLGFKANDGECSTMALAAFGEPKYADKVRKIIRVKDNGLYEIDLSYFDFGKWDSLPLTTKFIKNFGQPRSYKSTIPFNCLTDTQENISEDNQRFADIAASIQLVLEEAVLGLVRYSKEITGSDNLCIAGGVALNAVSNSKILQSKLFKEVFIPPDPGDGGGAMGAALVATMTLSGGHFARQKLHPYFGSDFCEKKDIAMLKSLDFSRVNSMSRFRGSGYLEIDEFSNQRELISQTAQSIAAGKIIGWCQGRFENGPRALGNRSILANPASIETAMRLSQKVKARASFRPYAFSIANGFEKSVFVDDEASHAPARWMQTSARVQPRARKSIRAALHTDGTSRPQVCSQSDNELYNELLNDFGSLSEVPALLNTSFNESGFPLVATSKEAIMMFLRTDMDILVLNNTFISWKRT